MNASQLKGCIINRTDNIVNDCNTFLWVRTEKKGILDQPTNVGGGNLLMALGLFATLNYLAKIYKLLREDAGIKEDEVKAWKKALKKLPLKLRKVVEPKKVGQLNETECFKELAKDAPHNFGLDSAEIGKVWDELRNKLTHIASPKAGNIIITFVVEGSGYHELKKAVERSTAAVFCRAQGLLECYVDLLCRDVTKISRWLCDEIDKGTFREDRVMATLEWLRKEMES